MANIAVAFDILHVIYPTNRGAMVGGDDPLSTATLLAISGHVYDSNAAPVVGATVVLYRQIDNLAVATTASGVGGAYSFPRRNDDTRSYYTVAYSLAGGSTQVHGTSNRGLVPA